MDITTIRNFELSNYQVNPGEISNNDVIDRDVCKRLADLYKSHTKVNDTWELLDVHLTLDPFQPYLNIFREFKFDYLEREHKWYLDGAETGNLSIKPDMSGVKIWEFCASKDAFQEINSNYGYLVFNPGNGCQFDYCLNKLKYDKNSREAMIIYTRPSIQWECQERGKHDFICQWGSHFFIRDNKLICLHKSRSMDAVTGAPYDFAFLCFVYQLMLSELQKTYPELESGKIHLSVDSLHVYERSENLLKKYVEGKND